VAGEVVNEGLVCGGMSGSALMMSRSRSRNSRKSALFSTSMKTARNWIVADTRKAQFAPN